MYRKKMLTLAVSAALIAAMTLTACGNTAATTDTTETTAEAGGTAELGESTFTGTVTEVSGNQITMTVTTGMGGGMGGMGGMEMPSGQMTDPATGDDSMSMTDENGNTITEGNTEMQGDGQTPPEMPDGSMEMQGDGQTPPEKPDGSTGGQGGATTGSVSGSNAEGGLILTSASTNNSLTSSGSSLTASDGSAPSDAGSAPSDGGSAPADAGSTAPSDMGSMSFDMGAMAADMGSSSMTVVLTISDTSLVKDSDGNTVELSDIAEGDSLTVTLDEDGTITSVVKGSSTGDRMGQGGAGGGSSAPTSYTAVTEYSTDATEDGKDYSSTGTDESAVLVDGGATVKISNATVDRTSSDSTGGDNSSFYGVGASVLTTDGTLYLSDSKVTTDAAGGAGVFAYGDGTVYVSDTTISTSQDTSGGIHVAGGGTLYAYDCDVTTQGESSAAIRSDRGGGTLVVDGGSYTSNGTGSPAVYCTADISVNDAELTANGSEAVCIEGLNTLRLYDCDLTGNMSDNEQNDCTWNIIVYQSMSGDSQEGNGTFSMIGGSLTAKNGGMFYTTNTESTFYLSGVDITYAADNDFFLKCTGNSNARGWGSTGSNGADCSFTADDQEMEGDVIWDTISQLDFYMENGSSLTGAVIDDESNAGNGGNGYCNVYIDSSSSWIVTGDSTVTDLYNAGTIKDADGKTVTIKGTDGTVYVQGDSSYTITVSSYSTTADLSGAAASTSFSDYAVANPVQ